MPGRKRPLTLQEKFDAWVAVNPHIVKLFLQYAQEARDLGFKSYGVKCIAERVRWHVRATTRGDDFKFNNNWSSRMARLIVKHDPSFEGLFEFRKLTARSERLTR